MIHRLVVRRSAPRAPEPTPSPRSPRARTGATALGLLALALLAGCASPTDIEQVLGRADDAEALWMSTRPVRYEAVERRICECLPEMSGPARIEVTRRQGATVPSETEMLVGGVYVTTGEVVPATYLPLFLTVQGLFDRIREAADKGVYQLEAEFDAEYGYPRRLMIDRDATVADDEIVYELEVVEME